MPAETAVRDTPARCLRPLVIPGLGSPRGGQTVAVLFSFTSTCQRLGVEPWAYLQDVLTRLPTTPHGHLGDLLPGHWQATRRAEASPPAVPAADSAVSATTPAS